MKTKLPVWLGALVACLAGSARADEVSLAIAPPVVVRTVPVAGSTDVDPALTEIRVSLVRLTGQNFSQDWNAWGKWWNEENGRPPYQPEIIRWWNGQPEPDELRASLAEGNRKFLESLGGK